ncbi:hypothetical protein VTO73DRAFT_12550 [Trametes versicolor]
MRGRDTPRPGSIGHGTGCSDSESLSTAGPLSQRASDVLGRVLSRRRARVAIVFLAVFLNTIRIIAARSAALGVALLQGSGSRVAAEHWKTGRVQAYFGGGAFSPLGLLHNPPWCETIILCTEGEGKDRPAI